MPSLITHYLCGEKAAQLLENTPGETVIKEHRALFNLGTQGPDIFFYHRVWPWTKSQGVEKIGHRMHEYQVGDFFSQAINYIINQRDGERNRLTAYLCGYLCHYALDLYTHPYIFFKSGFIRPGELSTAKYTCYHRIFETALDLLMLDRMLKKRPTDLRISQLIQVEKEEAGLLGKMYQSNLEMMGISVTTAQVVQAIQDMICVQAVLADRWGLKKRLLSSLERILGKYPLMSSMIYPAVIADGLDYLNMRHSPWSLPWDRSVESRLSFPELFDLAVQEAKGMCEALLLFLSGQGNIQDVLQAIGNRSFSTGLDCCLNLEFHFYNCIFAPVEEKGKASF
ncbi:zinc dependent phospholipase C family protein [Candidatus Formimonas warabiya]|uniref:Phospholipase C/D domain-containing protein n=1 Tax=Formimonas warabiya TaxID=1761012 RepID=A0A3G1KTG3_FORW1|nr:zinc dependent phospholipase C family protein [Candidatus Formimonas warabiya]ATW25720.1 hypothetical protein DCMF_13965 [Candidatus Formimonas warabiya]